MSKPLDDNDLHKEPENVPQRHCQICFHKAPGHYDDCPVLTQEPVRAMSTQEALYDCQQRLLRHLEAIGAEPFWMQDVRCAQRRIDEYRRQRAAHSGSSSEGVDGRG